MKEFEKFALCKVFVGVAVDSADNRVDVPVEQREAVRTAEGNQIPSADSAEEEAVKRAEARDAAVVESTAQRRLCSADETSVSNLALDKARKRALGSAREPLVVADTESRAPENDLAQVVVR